MKSLLVSWNKATNFTWCTDERDSSTPNENCWQDIQEYLQVWPGPFPDLYIWLFLPIKCCSKLYFLITWSGVRFRINHRSNVVEMTIKIVRNVVGCNVTPTTYRIAENFHEHRFSRITNKHARKKFCDFYFRDNSWCLTTPLTIFLHGNDDPQCVFRQNDHSKTLSCLSKRVSCCQQETARPREGANCEDLFAVAVTTGKLIVGSWKISQASTTK